MTASGRIRDPEQRIREIGRAAADLIAEGGVEALTHRAVAARAGVAVGTTTRYFATIDDLRRHALEYLADRVDRDLAELAEGLAAADDPIAFLAAAAHADLSDHQTVLAECSLEYAGLFEEDFRDLALRWHTGLTELLAPYFGRARSEMLAMCLDGVYITTALTVTPPDAARLEATIRALATMPESTDLPGEVPAP
ncbi:TetR family transcriptional regulator [Dietzia sp. CH92]|uniref:TetR/AcrR family transcriptional regulator n=1 Tax=Dietzia sp. CH92 TaxID=3051823 RepID=UPI0028D07117|nr:TetR family transcriptional regulator [Dietzia sp. CH92]